MIYKKDEFFLGKGGYFLDWDGIKGLEIHDKNSYMKKQR